MTTLPPYLNEPTEWHTLAGLRHYFHRSLRTLRRWCVDGTLAEAGASLYRDRRGKWWVKLRLT
jgi:hypothetical protein